jgi:hypothetical protein
MAVAHHLRDPDPAIVDIAESIMGEHPDPVARGLARRALIGDQICVTPEKQMFNGAHRCAAVISAEQSIPVLIDWNADPELFDLIDIGRKRQAYQLITDADATELLTKRVLEFLDRVGPMPAVG